MSKAIALGESRLQRLHVLRQILPRPYSGKDDIQGGGCLASQHQEVRGEPCHGMHRASVRSGENRNVQVPVSNMATEWASDHGSKSAIEVLDQSIRWRMRSGGPGLRDVQKSAHFLEESALEVVPLVRVDLERRSKTAHKFVDKCLCNPICLLVRQREHLDPACEIITSDYQVFVSLSRHRQGTHYINCHPVKWGADSIILECSPMFPMTCFASLTSVTECDVLLDVWTHPKPVESLMNPREGLTQTKMGREESVMGVPQDVCLVVGWD